LIVISLWLLHWICWCIPTVLFRKSKWVWSLLCRLAVFFSNDRFEFLSIIQLVYFAFKSVCFLFLAMCSFQVVPCGRTYKNDEANSRFSKILRTRLKRHKTNGT
jgi:hypothetical protein